MLKLNIYSGASMYKCSRTESVLTEKIGEKRLYWAFLPEDCGDRIIKS